MSSQLRLISWNVCDGFERKFGHLERLHPDIAILQEVRPGCVQYAGLTSNSHWVGLKGQKGLAAISYGEWKLSEVPLSIPEQWFLPLRATKGEHSINVVAVWADSSRECTPPTLRALGQLEEFI